MSSHLVLAGIRISDQQDYLFLLNHDDRHHHQYHQTHNYLNKQIFIWFHSHHHTIHSSKYKSGKSTQNPSEKQSKSILFTQSHNNMSLCESHSQAKIRINLACCQWLYESESKISILFTGFINYIYLYKCTMSICTTHHLKAYSFFWLSCMPVCGDGDDDASSGGRIIYAMDQSKG